MKWWAIIKLIAGIISNLPFDASEDEVKAVVAQAVSDVQSEPGVMADAGIPQSDWEELIGLLTPIILWILKRFGK
jgi:hypothetical protein